MVEGRETLVGKKESSSEFRLLADLGGGLKLYDCSLAALKEQDVNARLMSQADYAQLVNNIRKTGHMESVPYCAVEGDKSDVIQIVSGHHRIRAAKEAGLQRAPVLIDESGLKRPEIVAKQLAHNRISGFDDNDTLRRLFAELDQPDLVLESGLANDLIEVDNVELDTLLHPHLDMDWRMVVFSFLPHQARNLETLIEMMPNSDLTPVASIDQFDAFMQLVVKYSRIKNVRNAGMAIAYLTEVALRELDRHEAREKEWSEKNFRAAADTVTDSDGVII
jgi:hypothetical protein